MTPAMSRLCYRALVIVVIILAIPFNIFWIFWCAIKGGIRGYRAAHEDMLYIIAAFRKGGPL